MIYEKFPVADKEFRELIRAGKISSERQALLKDIISFLHVGIASDENMDKLSDKAQEQKEKFKNSKSETVKKMAEALPPDALRNTILHMQRLNALEDAFELAVKDGDYNLAIELLEKEFKFYSDEKNECTYLTNLIRRAFSIDAGHVNREVVYTIQPDYDKSFKNSEHKYLLDILYYLFLDEKLTCIDNNYNVSSYCYKIIGFVSDFFVERWLLTIPSCKDEALIGELHNLKNLFEKHEPEVMYKNLTIRYFERMDIG